MATISKSHLEAARLRRSQEDLDRILDALVADGSISVEDDPEAEQLPEAPEELSDEEKAALGPRLLIGKIDVSVDSEDVPATIREGGNITQDTIYEDGERTVNVVPAQEPSTDAAGGTVPDRSHLGKTPAEKREDDEDEELPGRHDALDAYAKERGIDLGDADTVAEKQEAIRAARAKS